jgi:hypothetical protein
MTRGYEFDRILRAALPLRRQPRGTLYIFSERKSHSRGHFQTSTVAGVLGASRQYEPLLAPVRGAASVRGFTDAAAGRGRPASAGGAAE